MQVTDTTPDEYLASLSDEAVRATMLTLDAAIVAAMPGRRRVLWEGTFWGGTQQCIIGYGDITQPRSRGGDIEWFAVGLARQKAIYSVYVNAVEDGAYLGQRHGDRLGKVKIGAASIGIRKLDDLDLHAFTELIARAHALTPPDPAVEP